MTIDLGSRSLIAVLERKGEFGYLWYQPVKT